MRLVPLIDEGLGNSAYLLDVGDGRALAVGAGHISGAVAIPLRAQFATWLVDRDTPIVIVCNPDQPLADILWAALNIGVKHIAGELDGGMAGRTGPVNTTLLERSGHRDLGVLVGGPADWAAATGNNLWEGQ
jgi:rhodanese-related sulfurtransferase